MASLTILCSDPYIFSKDSTKKLGKKYIKKIFCSPSKNFKNISWTINICLKYLHRTCKSAPPHPLSSCILNVRSLKWNHYFWHQSYFLVNRYSSIYFLVNRYSSIAQTYLSTILIIIPL